jgi:FRG domain
MPVPLDWSQNLREFVNGWWKANQDGCRSDDYLGDAPFHKFVLTERAASWDEFLAWVNELQGSWCFRGQRNAQWNLDTSLDLAVRRDNSGGYYHLDREPQISELLFLFQQQAHQYVAELPSSDDLSSWFALMQHHGAPTGFLDWTKSSYVALYFAFEEDPPEEGCALWAIDLEWLEKKARKLLPTETPTSSWGDFKERAAYVNGLLGQTERPVILQVNPVRLDARMVAQQGFFLCKLYHRAAFSLILMSMMMHPKTLDGPDIPDRPVVRRLVLKRELRIGFLKNLRAMNIHRASLFPGLDGLGKSLRLDLEMKEKE